MQLQERTAICVFISLLGRKRFFGAPVHRRLPALLERSIDNEEELAGRLGKVAAYIGRSHGRPETGHGSPASVVGWAACRATAGVGAIALSHSAVSDSTVSRFCRETGTQVRAPLPLFVVYGVGKGERRVC